LHHRIEWARQSQKLFAEDPTNSDRNWRGLSERVSARTCVVAGLLDDGAKDCLERGRQLRKGNPESKAFEVEGKRYAWDLQDQELFARRVKAWLEHEEPSSRVHRSVLS
jgi:hypothetical protein